MAYVSSLTVPDSTVASTLTNFVVRVDLAHLPAGWWADTTSDLGNVRVKSGGSVVPFDILPLYDRTAKTGELFFKAPSITTGATVFTIETVDGATALPATDTNGRNNVWSDYLAVVMAAETINRVNGNAPSATAGTITNSASGLFTFDTTQRLTFTVTKPTTWTIGYSGAPVSADAGNAAALTVNTEATTGDADREVFGSHGGTGNDPPALWNTTDSWLDAAVDFTTSRQRFNAQHNGTTSRTVWVAGALSATDNTVAAKPSGTGTAFQIAGRNGDGGGSRWNGTLGYAYLRNSILSADWLAAEYKSWETPSSFYVIAETVMAPAASASADGVAPSLSLGADVAAVAAVGSADGVAPTVTASGSADVAAPAASATAAGVVPVVSGSALVEPPAAAATAAGVVPSVAASASATVVATVATASAAAVAPYVSNDSPNATILAPCATATAAAVAPVPVVVLGADTSNVFSGRSRDGLATVVVTVPVVTPIGVATTRVDKAVPLPLPVLVKGRPT